MPEVSTMEAILSSVGQVFTSAVGWMGELIDVIVAEPLLMLSVICVPLVGIGVGLLGRLIRL